MWPVFIIIYSPGLDSLPCIFQGDEPVLVQTLVT